MSNVIEKRFQFTLLVLRVVLGTVMLAHGMQKLFGWFGGYGYDGTMAFFTGAVGLPYMAGLAIILAESAGMLLLIAGVLGRYMAGSLVLIMIGAIVSVHGSYGFYMNWDGTQGGEGYEFHLLVIALAVAVVINGTGAYSLDRYLLGKLQQKDTYFI